MSQAKYFDIIRNPIVTEKSTLISELGKYVFEVQKDSTKLQIKKAIEHIFSVKVKKINTLLVKGKIKRFRGNLGKRNDVKKAVVTLEKDQTIDLAFEV